MKKHNRSLKIPCQIAAGLHDVCYSSSLCLVLLKHTKFYDGKNEHVYILKWVFSIIFQKTSLKAI